MRHSIFVGPYWVVADFSESKPMFLAREAGGTAFLRTEAWTHNIEDALRYTWDGMMRLSQPAIDPEIIRYIVRVEEAFSAACKIANTEWRQGSPKQGRILEL